MNQIDTINWLTRVDFRTAAENDLHALEWEGEFVHFRRLYRQIFEHACQGKAVIWLADIPEIGVVGQLFVQLVSNRPELADGVQRAYIYGFRIKPKFQRQGLGSQMLQRIEKDLIDRHYRWATLNVSRDNLLAIRFYKQSGYSVVDIEPGRWSYIDHQGEIREVNEPGWRMEKSLL